MSLHPKTEAQELRERLQGAIADRATLMAEIASLSARLIAAEDRNAAQRLELEKLRGEKAHVWGKLLEEDHA